ncbi:MAG: bifunctional 3,4-dihydroxy-2-butanone-4-phosphate synthase/GTP cyclohydrolase II [Pseudomonadota bacterium]
MSAIAPIPDLLDALRRGEMIILVDEEDRENEGDLVLAADFVTPQAINFMAKYGRGLICLTLTQEHSQRLNLSPMVSANQSSHGTNFTVSIEAATGVTTGISAADRAHTIRTALNPTSKPTDIVQPGHIFPITAVPGGVLMRAGHTEAGCDLARLANLTPASVICEIMNDDGTMARLPDLMIFAEHHNLKIGTIADLIDYRHRTERLLECIGERPIETLAGEFLLKLYREKLSGVTHLVLIHGDISDTEETLVRVHEPTSLIDFLDHSNAQQHSWSIPASLKRLKEAPSGIMILLYQNESSEMLSQRVLKPDAFKCSGNDLRHYGVGAQILRDLGVKKMRLLAKPRKMPSMAGFHLETTGYELPEH